MAAGDPLASPLALRLKKRLSARLEQLLRRHAGSRVLHRSMAYSLLGGGKRFRPLLLLLTLDALGEKPEKGIDPACALEMVHCYSLVHDDLPILDNDDLRRGLPTNHRVFGEPCALLAGDALLTTAFAVLAGAALDPAIRIALVAELSLAAGPRGMILGQWDELENADHVSEPILRRVCRYKTGMLIRAGVLMAARVGGIALERLGCFEKFGLELGLLFQLTDDLLDSERDRARGQANYAVLRGRDRTVSAIQASFSRATRALSNMDLPHPVVLSDLLRFVRHRTE